MKTHSRVNITSGATIPTQTRPLRAQVDNVDSLGTATTRQLHEHPCPCPGCFAAIDA